jgi:hypothetical protein
MVLTRSQARKKDPVTSVAHDAVSPVKLAAPLSGRDVSPAKPAALSSSTGNKNQPSACTTPQGDGFADHLVPLTLLGVVIGSWSSKPELFGSIWCQLLAAYTVLISFLLAHKRTAASPLVDLLRLFFLFPIFCLTIAFDSSFPQLNPFVGFPRDAAEIFRDPRAFFSLLTRSAVAGKIPAGAEYVSLVPFGLLTAEPDKNSTISKMLLTFKVGAAETSLPFFVKFQTSRGTPYW